MIKKTIPFLNILLVLALAACSSVSAPAPEKTSYPQSPEDVRRARAGSLFGDSGFKLFGGKLWDSEDSGSGSVGINVNSYLWRASLDTLAFMPLVSADPFGGVIITDWYEDPDAKGERFKVNLLILNKKLRSDAVKVTVFKQSSKSGSWHDVKVSEKVARDLENKVLTRARELKVEKESR